MPFIERFFPAVARKAKANIPTGASTSAQEEESGSHDRDKMSSDAVALLSECVVCFGTLSVDALPLRPKY